MVLSSLTWLLLAPAVLETRSEVLAVGDAAPAIQVAEWIKGEPVASFQKGQTYVVEFWATWCGPCRRSIPHLSELQQKYGDKVKLVGVSVWEEDPSGVAPFVEKMGDKMAYTVARDLVPEGADPAQGVMARSWMQAANQNGIPAAFIVDGQGRIAWIGNPIDAEEPLDGPLAEVVAGTWDIEAARADFQAQGTIDEAEGKVVEAVRNKDWKTVIAVVDQTLARYPKAAPKIGAYRFQAELRLGQMDAAYAFGAKLVDELAKDSAAVLNEIAWTIVDPTEKWERKDLPLALRAAERASSLTEDKNPYVLDTLAKVHFDLGHLDRAVETQKKALEYTKADDPTRGELEGRLKQYEEALKSQQN